MIINTCKCETCINNSITALCGGFKRFKIFYFSHQNGNTKLSSAHRKLMALGKVSIGFQGFKIYGTSVKEVTSDAGF